MKKTDARVERNTSALFILVECLEKVRRAPESFRGNKELVAALKSQGSTAALNFSFTVGEETKTTTPVSLNTLKTYAESNLPIGFDGLNKLRVAALEALEASERREERSNKRTKVGLSLRVAELEQKLALHQKTNLTLLHALGNARDHIKSVRDAPNAGVRSLRAQEAIKALTAMASLNAPPYDKLPAPDGPSVVNLDEYRR
jgi:hypothetical protein